MANTKKWYMTEELYQAWTETCNKLRGIPDLDKIKLVHGDSEHQIKKEKERQKCPNIQSY